MKCDRREAILIFETKMIVLIGFRKSPFRIPEYLLVITTSGKFHDKKVVLILNKMFAVYEEIGKI